MDCDTLREDPDEEACLIIDEPTEDGVEASGRGDASERGGEGRSSGAEIIAAAAA